MTWLIAGTALVLIGVLCYMPGLIALIRNERKQR